MTPGAQIFENSPARLRYSYWQFSHSHKVVLFFAASWWLESMCSQSVSQLHSPKRVWGETQLFRYLEVMSCSFHRCHACQIYCLFYLWNAYKHLSIQNKKTSSSRWSYNMKKTTLAMIRSIKGLRSG